MYDKRNDFEFEIVNFLFLDGDVLRSTPMESIPRSLTTGVY